MARCFVGLGANQGNPSETFNRVKQSLESLNHTTLTATSSSYLSRAMGSLAGGDFLNAVVELETSLSPTRLLTELQSIENRLGRRREVIWGPRIIDLDLLYLDDVCLAQAGLTLPHPHAWYRRFVLEPMCEIAADYLHPLYSLTQWQLLQRIDRIPFKLRILGVELLPQHIRTLKSEFAQLQIAVDPTPGEDDSLIVGRLPAKLAATVPVVNPERLPATDTEDLLRRVLEACLGRCERIA